jgi:GNAT superfamily N-acetyltransferase
VIAALLGELGYPTTPDEARMRLEAHQGHAGLGAIVADLEGAVIGLAAYQLLELLYSPAPQCRLTTLVVTERHRHEGVARALVAQVETLARELGCFRLEVTTQPSRAEAVAFYEACGFELRPHRFVMVLR